MSIHSVSIKGHRDSNEDKHKIFTNLGAEDKTKSPINLYGVFDGHGGAAISKFCHDNIPECFMDKRISYPLTKKVVNNIYDFFQNKLRTEYKKISTNTGSTCLIVIHFKKDESEYLNVINTGDSRCIICRNNFGIPLTRDHKPDWFDERGRLKSLGEEPIFDGYDWRIKDLSVSRAFGDLSAEPYVTNMPDMFRYQLTNNDAFMVLACDGLWDKLSNQDVVNFVLNNCYDCTTGTRINKNINIAKRLAELSLIKGSTDNVTVIVVFFKENLGK